MTTTTATKERKQPPWTSPSPSGSSPDTSAPRLSIFNSLTRQKNEFFPIDVRGKKVTWYCCGPTVYDAGHLGHARNYVTTDILRRIMRDYFGYEVVFVQNVTDVDDKIILRARQGFLLDEFKGKHKEVDETVKSEARKAWDAYVEKNMEDAKGVEPADFSTWAAKAYPDIFKVILADQDKLKSGKTEKEREEEEAVLLDEKATKKKMHLTTLLVSSVALTSPVVNSETFYAATGPVLVGYLDNLPENRTRSYEKATFSKLSAFWEAHFNEDMRRLNVLPPTITTRVSEFIPQNIAFVEKLVEKGFAYQTEDGSVYFDIEAYEAKGHHYAKLEPWNKGNQGLIADGEGALSAGTAVDSSTTESGVRKSKKSNADFAVWKASKQGEPGWDSPWGSGRPGWHIECSVMCSEVLGGKVDIHSGGIDLAFPHHDNELAQSEAYWDDPCVNAGGERHQWINYFLHMGHLSIQGSKMSKSLKNFVSIREALAEGGGWTPRGLRIVFLLGGWKEGIEIGKDLIAEAKAWEARVNKFFSVVKGMVAEEAEREKNKEFIPQPFGPREKQLMDDLDKAQLSFHANLCNSFATSAALDDITSIIASANAYIQSNPQNLTPLKEVAAWITRQVRMFGLESGPLQPIGWSLSSSPGGEESVDKEEILAPYLRALSSFRDSIRQTAVAAMKAPETKELAKTLLTVSDQLRNEVLPPLGVRLDDREGQPALIKLESPESILAEIREKEEKARQKAAEKAKREAEAAEKEREREKKERVDPKEMFKTEEYEAWDEDGLPIRLKGGEELPKSRQKKVKKEWERQKKVYEARLKKDAEAASAAVAEKA